ncbi:MAG: prepilin peptidase [Acidimicrobiales bacterium]
MLLAAGCGVVGLVVGWVVHLRIERIPGCETRPVWQAPATTIATAGLFAAAALRFGFDVHLPVYLMLFTSLVAVSVIDIRAYRIPNRIVFATLAVTAPMIVAVSLLDGPAETLGYAAGGAVLFFVMLLIPHLINPKGMGFGDVKLAFLMGLHLGWLADDFPAVISLVFTAIVAGSVLGIVVGLVFRVVRRGGAPFPFGPALATGAAVVILASEVLLRS